MKSPLTSAIALGMLLAALAGCQRDDPARAEGPAEKVGQKIDQAAVKATEGINKLAEKAGAGMEKAGENIRKEAEQAQAKNGEKK
jgi:hypothetical protein